MPLQTHGAALSARRVARARVILTNSRSAARRRAGARRAFCAAGSSACMVCSFRQAAARRCCRSRERSSGSESTESAIEAIGPKKEKWALTACGSVYARGRHETRTWEAVEAVEAVEALAAARVVPDDGGRGLGGGGEGRSGLERGGLRGGGEAGGKRGGADTRQRTFSVRTPISGRAYGAAPCIQSAACIHATSTMNAAEYSGAQRSTCPLER